MNTSQQIDLIDSIASTDARPAPTTRKRKQRFTEAQKHELIEQYLAGESTRELADATGLHRHSITRLLKEEGVEVRHKRRRLTDDQVTQAAELYEQGWTLAQLAEVLQVGIETIRRELINAGIKLRSRGGRH